MTVFFLFVFSFVIQDCCCVCSLSLWPSIPPRDMQWRPNMYNVLCLSSMALAAYDNAGSVLSRLLTVAAFQDFLY